MEVLCSPPSPRPLGSSNKPGNSNKMAVLPASDMDSLDAISTNGTRVSAWGEKIPRIADNTFSSEENRDFPCCTALPTASAQRPRSEEPNEEQRGDFAGRSALKLLASSLENPDGGFGAALFRHLFNASPSESGESDMHSPLDVLPSPSALPRRPGEVEFFPVNSCQDQRVAGTIQPDAISPACLEKAEENVVPVRLRSAIGAGHPMSTAESCRSNFGDGPECVARGLHASAESSECDGRVPTSVDDPSRAAVCLEQLDRWWLACDVSAIPRVSAKVQRQCFQITCEGLLCYAQISLGPAGEGMEMPACELSACERQHLRLRRYPGLSPLADSTAQADSHKEATLQPANMRFESGEQEDGITSDSGSCIVQVGCLVPACTSCLCS